MTMTFRGGCLGGPADGRPLTLRVMDLNCCEAGRIAEIRVFFDYMSLMVQMDRGVRGHALPLAPAGRRAHVGSAAPEDGPGA